MFGGQFRQTVGTSGFVSSQIFSVMIPLVCVFMMLTPGPSASTLAHFQSQPGRSHDLPVKGCCFVPCIQIMSGVGPDWFGPIVRHYSVLPKVVLNLVMCIDKIPSCSLKIAGLFPICGSGGKFFWRIVDVRPLPGGRKS